MNITSPIFNVFGRSPLKPIQRHIDIAHACVARLQDFFAAVLQNNWQEACELQQQIASLEKQADNIKKELRLNLPSSLFLPVARSDILELLSKQDRIANTAEDIAGLIIGRRMQIPAQLAEPLTQFLQHSVEASQQACEAIHKLDELLETGFRGYEIKLVGEMIVQLDHIEHKSDAMEVSIRGTLFSLEKSLPAVDTIFLYRIIQLIGKLADHAQSVGNRLQILLAR